MLILFSNLCQLLCLERERERERESNEIQEFFYSTVFFFRETTLLSFRSAFFLLRYFGSSKKKKQTWLPNVQTYTSTHVSYVRIRIGTRIFDWFIRFYQLTLFVLLHNTVPLLVNLYRCDNFHTVIRYTMYRIQRE